MAENYDMQNVPGMPEEVPSMPMETPDMPQEMPLMPQEIPVMPEETPLMPEDVPVMPSETPVMPEEVPAMPQDVPVMPEEIPPMPGEAPVMPQEVPPMPGEVPAYTSDTDAYATLAGHGRGRFNVEEEVFVPKVNKFSIWLEDMQYRIISNKIKLAKIGGGILGFFVALYIAFSFTFSYFVDFAFGRVVKNLNLPISSYNMVFADSSNLILVNVIDKNGARIAREVSVVYNMWDFILEGKVQSITISDLALRAEVKNNTLMSPVFTYVQTSSSLSKEDGRPKFSVDRVLVNSGVLTLYGEENGQAEFSLSGRIAHVFSFTSPVKLKTDTFTGSLDTKGSGWGRNYNISASFKDADMVIQGVPAKASGSFDVTLENNALKKWTFNSTYKAGRYDIKVDTSGAFNNGSLDASLKLVNTETKKETVAENPVPNAGMGALRTRRSAMNQDMPASQVVSADADAASVMLPVGNLEVTVAGAKVSGNLSNLKGTFPLKATSGGITFGTFKTGKSEFAADGVLTCQAGNCSYVLSKPMSVVVAGIVVPALNSHFDTKDMVNINIAPNQKPIFAMKDDKINFNLTLVNPLLRGAFAGVTSSNVFAAQAEKGILAGNVDFDGKYQATLLLDKLAYNDASFTINGGKLETSFSADKNPAVKLYASFVEMKGDKVLFPPSNLFLETVPDNDVHRFKLIIQTPTHSTSFFMAGVYDYLKDRGAAKFSIPEIAFSADKTPSQVFPFISADLKDVTGTFSAKGNISWGPSGISGPAMFSFANFSARKGDMKVSGLNGQFIVTNFSPLTTMPNQEVTVENFNLMFPFTNFRMKFALNGNNALVIDDFSANVAGGRATNIDRITLPFALNASPSMVVIKDVDMAALAKMLNMDITMNGKLNARLPIALRPNDVLVVNGDIQTAGSGYIKYRPTQTGSGEGNSVADVIFSDLTFSGIRGELNGSLDNKMNLKLKVQGKNPAYKVEQPFRRDIKLEGDFRSLIKMN